MTEYNRPYSEIPTYFENGNAPRIMLRKTPPVHVREVMDAMRKDGVFETGDAAGPHTRIVFSAQADTWEDSRWDSSDQEPAGDWQ